MTPVDDLPKFYLNGMLTFSASHKIYWVFRLQRLHWLKHCHNNKVQRAKTSTAGKSLWGIKQNMPLNRPQSPPLPFCARFWWDRGKRGRDLISSLSSFPSPPALLYLSSAHFPSRVPFLEDKRDKSTTCPIVRSGWKRTSFYSFLNFLVWSLG